MKNRSVQAISIGLSAISLVAPACTTIYAKAAEVVNDAEITTEQQVVSDSGEKAIAEEVSNLSEQLNTNTISQLSKAASAPATEGQFDEEVSAVLEKEATAKEAVGSVSASVDNIVKAGEAIDEVQTQVQDAVSQADSAIKNAGEATSAANEQAQGAVSVIKDENVSETDAATIIADTDKTVEEAQTAFDEAENKYNEALEAYNLAKDDYDTALAAYNTNKEEAAGNLNTAEAELESAQKHLEELQAQLEAAQKKLADAGADALVAAETNVLTASEEDRVQYGIEYLKVLLQYYQLPKAEGLTEGQSIEILNPDDMMSDDWKSVLVNYDVIDEEGNHIRNVIANYGYRIDDKTGEITFYSKELKSLNVKSVKLQKNVREKKSVNVSFTIDDMIFKEHSFNLGDEVWTEIVTDYATYISGVRAKLDAYNSLLASVEVAKADFQAAREKVVSIKTQIEELNGVKDIDSAAEMARLQGLLESAEADYNGAKDNLENAKATLSDAKSLFNEKFVKANSGSQTSSAGSIQSSSRSLASSIARLEARLDQELVELEEIQDEETPTTIDGKAVVSNIGEEKVSDAEDNSAVSSAEKSASRDNVVQPQDITPVPGEIVTIEEKETPLAITLAGLLQHGKWFAGLAGVFAAGAGVGVFEVKRRAATKIIDKLNQ
jgi:chromosome segregation ATPase